MRSTAVSAKIIDYTEISRNATKPKLSYVNMGYRYDTYLWLITHQWTQADGLHIRILRYVGKTRYVADVVCNEELVMGGGE